MNISLFQTPTPHCGGLAFPSAPGPYTGLMSAPPFSCMRRPLSAAMFALCCSLSASQPAWAQADASPPAGMVKQVTGAVQLVCNGASAAALPGQQILVGDTLRTGPGSGVALALRDDTLMSVGADSELQVTAFTFDSTTQDGNLLASVWRGTVAFVTGLIAKKTPENVRVQTRTVVLGVRGTEFIVDAGRGAP